MMPGMCVIYGSNTTRNVKEGIYIHAIPYLDEKKEIMGRIWAQIGNLRAGHSGQFLLKAFRIVTGISTRKILQIDS